MKKIGYHLVFLLMAVVANASAANATTTYTSKANVTFVPDKEPTDPKDPDDPDQPGNPGGEVGGGTGMNGPLSLDYVPRLEFGVHNISGNMETYFAADRRAYLQVSDKRGNGAGWRLSAKMGSFLRKDAARQIPAAPLSAKITFRSTSLATTSANGSAPPYTVNLAELVSGGEEQKLLGTVHNGEGRGTWLARYYPTGSNIENDSITLTLDTSAVYVGSYEAAITWILSDAP